MIVLVNCADDKYRKAQKFNSWTGRHIARFDKVFEYNIDEIDVEYKESHQDILSVKRGNGLWLWKPYFVYRTLKELNYGDVLFYCDSGAYFIRPVKSIINKIDKDIWITDLPLLEKQFTKPEAFDIMSCRDEIYKESNQMQASFFYIRKNEFTMNFIQEWLNLCENKELLYDGQYRKTQAFDRYIAHREDQSILSLLAKKYSVTPDLDPTQYGVLPEKYYHGNEYIFRPAKHEKIYKPFIVLHRTPDNNFKTCLNQYLCAVLPRSISIHLIVGLNR